MGLFKDKPAERSRLVEAMFDRKGDEGDEVPKNITATHHMVREDGTQVVEIEIGAKSKEQDRPRLLGSFLVARKHHLHIYILGEVVEMTGFALPQPVGSAATATATDSPSDGQDLRGLPNKAKVEVAESEPPPSPKADPGKPVQVEEGQFVEAGRFPKHYDGDSKPTMVSGILFKSASGEIVQKVGVQLVRIAEEMKLRNGDRIRLTTLPPKFQRGGRRTNQYDIEVLARAP